MYIKLQYQLFIIPLLLSFCYLPAQGQTGKVQDSLPVENDTVISIPDSSIITGDTTKITNDSLPAKDKSKISENAVEQIVDYKAKDSIRFELKTKKMYLYEEATMDYGETSLKAANIDISFQTNMLYAKGAKDSLGNPYGRPIFADKGQEFKSKEMTYNFKTKKGLIKEVITQDGESYIHGNVVKKMPDNVTFIKDGKYTTCSHEHPHYEFRFNKAKVIPKDKIVTSRVWFVVEDVPTPVFLPFGMFPNKKGRQSGIIVPAYGESKRDGFFLQNGGYYWGINDYMDVAFKGYISTRGSWKTNLLSNYKKRYKFNGNVDLDYALTKESEKGLPDYSEARTFFVRWRHQQDPKARPNSTFNANVNAGSSKHKTLRPENLNDFHQNTLESSVSYSTSWSQGKYNLTSSLRHKQNTKTHEVNLNLPELSLSRSRIYPFRGQNAKAGNNVLDNISIGYSMNTSNRLKAIDSTLFDKETLDDFQYGMQHSIPLQSNVKIFKYFNLNNSVNYTERWYPSQIRKVWRNDTLIEDQDGDGILDTVPSYLYVDTLEQFSAARDFSFNSTINTKLYGMFQFKNGPVKAVRHVVTPSIGYTYRPDFADPRWGYYKYYVDENYNPNNPNAEPSSYSVFSNGIFGSPPKGKTGSINFGLKNNIEMKVKSDKDTSGLRKVKLIENFSLGASYDLTKDTMPWSYINMSGYTKLFKDIDVRYNGTLDPYVIEVDSVGSTQRINKTEWAENNRIARFKKSSWSLGVNYNLSSTKLKKRRQDKEGEETEEQALREDDMGLGSDTASTAETTKKDSPYEIPWNFGLSYTFTHNTNHDIKGFENYRDIVQNLSFNGSISPTDRWKFSFRSSYDFEAKKLSYINVNIHRDLHCWEILFNWVPLGYGGNTSYHFTIRLKSSLLQDVKWEKKKKPWDN